MSDDLWNVVTGEVPVPAFPVHIPSIEGERPSMTYFGMTLRDYFAAAALNGFISGLSSREKLAEVWGDAKLQAKSAYQIADAMLAERNKDAKSSGI